MSSLNSQELMAGVDRAWLRMDHPTNLMVINSLMVLDGKVDREWVQDIVENRLIVIPRFRCRVVEPSPGGRHQWECLSNLDYDYHIVESTLPEPGNQETLQEYIGDRTSEPLDMGHPPWRIYLIHGYQGRSALLWRLHHCIGDGMVLMLVVLSFTDSSREPGRNPLAELFQGKISRDDAKAHLTQVMPEAVPLLVRPSEALAATNKYLRAGASVPALGKVTALPPDKKTPLRGPLGIPKRVAWSETYSMAAVKSLKEKYQATVNDVLLTAMAGSLREYLEYRGEDTLGLNFRGVIPVSLRPIEEMATLGNHFGLVFLSLPIGIADPRERLIELKRRMSKLKRSMEPAVALHLLRVIGRSPKRLQDLVVRIFGSKGTAVITNVPGPREHLFMKGHRIEEIMFWVPQSGRLGLGLSILSYAGGVNFGIVSDAGLVPDPERIAQGFNSELEKMSQL